MAITDLTNTTWILNNTLSSYPGGTYTTKTYSINITTETPLPYSGDTEDTFIAIMIGYDNGGEHNRILLLTSLPQNYYNFSQLAYGNDTKSLPDTWNTYYDKSFTITGGTDATNSTLIAWLEQNATTYIPPAPSVPDVVVSYKDAEVTTLSNSGTITLATSGTYCEDDIEIVYTKQGGGSVIIVDTPDSHGGTIREITATDSVLLQGEKTIEPSTSQQVIMPDTGYDGFSSVIVEAAGREDLVEPKDVDFIDYDGRLVYSYTTQEFLALNELPPNPTNQGLIAQGWNWTLADAKEFVGEYGALVIGQSYTTDDGKTRIYMHFPAMPANYTFAVKLWLTSTVTGSPTIYWGDGTSSVWSGQANANASMIHNYTGPSSPVIEIEVTNGTVSAFGRDGAGNSIVGPDGRIARCVQKIEIGNGVTAFAKNTFKFMCELKSVSVPNTLTTIIDYDESMFTQNIMKGFVFPKNFNTTRHRAMFPTHTLVNYVSIPKEMRNFHMATYPINLRKLTMYSMEPSSGVNCTVTLYDVYSVTHFVIPGTYTNIVTDTLRASSVKKIWIPASVTNISATAFAYNSLLEEVHVRATTPPTLAHVNAFRDLPSTCIIYVPYSSNHSILSAYQSATNWSTYASQMQEEPQQ